VGLAQREVWFTHSSILGTLLTISSHSTPTAGNKDVCTADLTIKAPRVLSSWSIRGFSVNEKYGLGFGSAASDLKVSEPITISTTLPYAVKRGEVMNVVLKVFNSYKTAQTVKVILWGYKNFEFVASDTPVLEQDSEYLIRVLSSTIIDKIIYLLKNHQMPNTRMWSSTPKLELTSNFPSRPPTSAMFV
jgi:Alpha-2-macroglobulin family